MFGMMIPNDSCLSRVETTHASSHGQDVVGVPDGESHVPPEDVAEKLQMAEATLHQWASALWIFSLWYDGMMR